MYLRMQAFYTMLIRVNPQLIQSLNALMYLAYGYAFH